MAVLKTILIVLVLLAAIFGLTPFALTAFILSFLGLRKLMALFVYKIAQGWAKITMFLTGCPLRVEGRENIPMKEGVCFVSNHVGIFDIILALAFIGRPFGFVAKKELIFVPFINIWIWLLGGLFIDRKDLKKARLTIDMGVKRIKQGGGMIIFPEGTRSKGKGLQSFRSGSFKLATQAEAVIVPVAIEGTYGVFERTGLVQKVPVDITFGKAIPTSEIPHEERKQVLSDRVHGIIQQMLMPATLTELQ